MEDYERDTQWQRLKEQADAADQTFDAAGKGVIDTLDNPAAHDLARQNLERAAQERDAARHHLESRQIGLTRDSGVGAPAAPAIERPEPPPDQTSTTYRQADLIDREPDIERHERFYR